MIIKCFIIPDFWLRGFCFGGDDVTTDIHQLIATSFL
jgi:hypothetical protein